MRAGEVIRNHHTGAALAHIRRESVSRWKVDETMRALRLSESAYAAARKGTMNRATMNRTTRIRKSRTTTGEHKIPTTQQQNTKKRKI